MQKYNLVCMTNIWTNIILTGSITKFALKQIAKKILTKGAQNLAHNLIEHQQLYTTIGH